MKLMVSQPFLGHPVIISWNRQAWLLGRDERLFTEIAPPTADRYAGPAGLAERADGSSYVVFGGGVTSPDYSSDRSTEILELGSLTWRAGPEAPHGLVGAASLPYGKSFVTVGGSEGGDQGFTDAIYRCACTARA